MSDAYTKPDDLPKVLPENPTGWTRDLVMHLNLGRRGGVASYEILDDRGVRMPFSFAYNTGEKTRGFYLLGSDECLTWSQLRQRWPGFVTAYRRLFAKLSSPRDAARAMSGPEPLPMVVIYERPADHPVGFVVRAWSVLPGKVIPAKLLGVDLPSIEAARELVPQGLVNVGRTDDDAACVVEAWC